MKSTTLVDQAAKFAREMMKNNDPSHDWHHVERVWKNAVHLAHTEEAKGADLEIVELGALFHDVVDFKYDHANAEGLSMEELAESRLNVFFDTNAPDYPASKRDQIVYIVNNISWRKELASKFKSCDLPMELKIVRDADRLDAIGATGVARCLAFTGARDRPIHVPDEKPIENMTVEQYNEQCVKNKSTAINHFYEKLLLIKDRMQTETGRQMAQQRHEFMQSFLDQFNKEVATQS